MQKKQLRMGRTGTTIAITLALAAYLIGFTAVSLVPAPAEAQARTFPPPVIAVLNYQKLLQDSAAGKSIRKQIDGYRGKYQKTLQAVQEKLKKEESELLKQRAIMSAEAFEKRRVDFERRVVDAQRDVQDRTRSLERALNEAMADVQSAIVPIVKDQTEKLGFNIVIDRSQIMLALDSLDITDIILAQLNKKLPTVKVKAPK